MTGLFKLRNIVDATEKSPDAILSELTYSKTRLLHGAVIASKEAGELLDAAAGHAFYNKPLDEARIANMVEECFDILYGVQVVLSALGYSVEFAIGQGQAKLTKRYPAGFSNAACAERADKQEATVGAKGTLKLRREAGSIVADTEFGKFRARGTALGFEVLLDGEVIFHGEGGHDEALEYLTRSVFELRQAALKKEQTK